MSECERGVEVNMEVRDEAGKQLVGTEQGRAAA